ncbi:uncharacterized protein (TIGR03086 family) [Haloactinospora alba]|uniref:Uncharacterized protein (TIGR03086 family) n=1 Tax=Haloactinospora alba TaxID=405555 RepID=A0A543NLW7_9ACTN|nr:TIGR03086 family metal-binding protein [Haloactinospora alba]TQN32797.1 uncharacterized protein (TIGR03086 family) [Haloactinospora alba]
MVSEPTLHRALDVAVSTVDGLGATPLDSPTPCAEWDLSQLLSHMINTLDVSSRGLSGADATPEEMDPQRTAAVGIDGTPAEALARTAARARPVFSDPGLWNRTVNAPMPGLPAGVAASLLATDLAVHSWDIARASGQDASLPDDLAQDLYEFCSGAITPEVREGVFAAEVEAPSDATPSDRLVAFLGRRP